MTSTKGSLGGGIKEKYLITLPRYYKRRQFAHRKVCTVIYTGKKIKDLMLVSYCSPAQKNNHRHVEASDIIPDFNPKGCSIYYLCDMQIKLLSVFREWYLIIRLLVYLHPVLTIIKHLFILVSLSLKMVIYKKNRFFHFHFQIQ